MAEIPSYYTGDTRTDFVYDGLMRLRHRMEYTFTCTGSVQQTSAQLAGEGAGTPTNCLSSLPLETYYIFDGRRVIQERGQSRILRTPPHDSRVMTYSPVTGRISLTLHPPLC